MNFNEKYNKIKELAKEELEIIEEKMTAVIDVREPLNTSLKNFLTSPSKHIRPLLAILYTKAIGEKISDKQLELLCAIELVHNASLIHDDIIDESKLRRGNKTLSAEFDNKLAVISGDYILAITMEKLTALDNLEIIKNFTRTIRQMCIGEINQNFDRFQTGTIDAYIEKTKNKTAYLFETALVCTLMLCKNPQNLEQAGKFALLFGTAFQIRDDILNFTKNDISKPSNNDLEAGIYNAPVILGDKSDNYLSGIEKTKDLLNNYIESAKKIIKGLPENQALEEFLELLKDV